MYKYDTYDQAIVDARVEEFRDQVNRRLSGAITEDQFKPLRLMNGLYLQLHAYMLRVAVPYGTLDGAQMRMLAHIARNGQANPRFGVYAPASGFVTELGVRQGNCPTSGWHAFQPTPARRAGPPLARA